MINQATSFCASVWIIKMDYQMFNAEQQLRDGERERVLHSLHADDIETATSIYDEVKGFILSIPCLAQEVHFGKIGNSLYQDRTATGYLPDVAKEKNLVPLTSEATGNCLYSSVSLLLVGDNTLVNRLRILTSLEMYLYADFYVKHPCILSAYQKSHFKSYVNMFTGLLVSHASVDSGKIAVDLVKEEAVHNCEDKTWSSFLCVLACASAVSRTIFTYYPDFGEKQLKLLFEQEIEPRTSSSISNFHLLFTLDRPLEPNESFKHNHIVPLVLRSQKRKTSKIPRKSGVQEKVTLREDVKSDLSRQAQQKAAQSAFTKNTVSRIPVSTAKFSQTVLSFPSIRKTVVSVASTSMLTKIPVSSVKPNSSRSTILSNNSSLSPSAVSCTPSKLLRLVSHTSCISSNQNTKNLNINDNESTSSLIAPIKQTPASFSSINADTCEDVLGNDVATYMNKARTMKHLEIIFLIENVFVPDDRYTFPNNNGRQFRREWLKKFPWLCYSPSCDGGFCLPCVLFAEKHRNSIIQTKNLVFKHIPGQPNAHSLFVNHEKIPKKGRSLHQLTSADFAAYISQNRGKTEPIEDILNKNLEERKNENKKLLCPIIDTILLCGRLGIPLRGHRDDAKYHPEIGGFATDQVGNFIELINYRARADPDFKEALEKRAKNATYISKTSQNELSICIGQVITDKIIGDIKSNKFYSVLADECMDSAGKEQLSLCLRYVDRNYDIKEDFLSYIHCEEGLSGEGLCKVLLKTLSEKFNLEIENCRGQGYDGAGSVAGHTKGLAARVLRINSKALYTHCHSHRLNLVIIHSCNVQIVQNVLSQIKELSYFFNLSEGRQILLENNVKKHCPSATRQKLIDVCRTRWIERIEGMDIVQDLFVAIVNTLEEMHLNTNKICNADTSSKASSFFKLVTSFDFIVTLVITRNIFDATLPVTQLLQSKGNDIMDGIHLINSLKSYAAGVRQSIDSYHNRWYAEALHLAESVNIPEEKPRTVCRQLHRQNTPAETVSDYFKKIITIPIIDHLNSELVKRFNSDSVTVYNGLAVIPSKLISLNNDNVDWKEKFKLFAEFYLSDLPNPTALNNELNLWEKYWATFQGSRPNNISLTLKCLDIKYFKNIETSLRILATLPVTTCECERSFSAMKLLKTRNRSTMTSDRLNALALMYEHKNFIPKTSDILDKYSLKNRRLEFS